MVSHHITFKCLDSWRHPTWLTCVPPFCR